VQGADSELTAAVQAAQEGDESAFSRVFRAVHPRLLGYVRTMVAERDVEDVTAEAWLHISRDLTRFSGDADRFRGWTTRIARNRALDHLRALSRRPQEAHADDATLAELPGGADTAEEAIAALATSHCFSLVRRLPQEQAGAVILRTVLGLDARRAAMLLGCRPGAVRTANHRGLRRLAQLVENPPEAVQAVQEWLLAERVPDRVPDGVTENNRSAL
jgi:RNA polymerase sigma-70 factor (ECF subfamily)